MRPATVSIVPCSMAPCKRSRPHTSDHSCSAASEAHDWACTPLVTDPTGTSPWGQRGKRGWNRYRLTWPCRRLTPLTAPLPRMAR